jgi:hypothetical protein
MKLPLILSLSAMLLSSSSHLSAQEIPKMPAPVKEHEWLKQLEGEWTSEYEAFMPGQKESVKGKGSESAKMLGGFWLIGNGKGEMMGMTMNSVLTLGFDPDKKKYVGTWVDSMTSYLWKYEGAVDSAGKILTLETEGPCMMKPGLAKFREVTEIVDKDHKTFTSSMLGDDGKWITIVKVTSTRKK